MNITQERFILLCLDNDNVRYPDGTGSSHQFAVGCFDAPADSNGDAGVDFGFGLVDGSEERSQLWQITNDAETEVEVGKNNNSRKEINVHFFPGYLRA